MIENICPECGKELIEDVKEVWCKRCGLVVEEKVSMGIEKDFDISDTEPVIATMSLNQKDFAICSFRLKTN